MPPSPSEILRSCGSDKETLHRYGRLYDELLAGKRQAGAVLEIGVQAGYSLRAWSEIFSAATIVGIDIGDVAAAVADIPRAEFVRLDAGDPAALHAFALANRERFDVIVDDASHEPAHQLLTRGTLWPALRVGGVLVIEDVHDEAACAALVELGGRVGDHRAESGHPYSRAVSFVRLPNPPARRPPCLCTGRTDIVCTDAHCDLAHPTGAPGDADKCVPCWQWHHSEEHNRVWGGDGRTKAPRRQHLPCVHLGGETGERIECGTCANQTRIKLFVCGKHGQCTTGKHLDGVACCRGCAEVEPDTYSLVAPWGTRDRPCRWEGRSPRKPWHYRVTASIPHLDTIEPLQVVIETLRAQTERPYIVIVDTGSPYSVCDELERLRADDLEIHYIRGHGYIQSSAPVTTAMDLAFALCRSEYHYTTHVDVFLKRPDYVAWLLSQCDAAAPAVGYEMSDRSWATDAWQGMVSHTASLFHVPTIRRLGAIWSMEHGYDLAGWTGQSANGWPDTETGFNLILRAQGIVPKLIAREDNYKRFEDGNLIHARSYPGRKICGLNPELLPAVEAHLRADMAETRQRVATWQSRGN